MTCRSDDLASAIERANAALDWIEARQGPLPADGYARIETSVGVVRALGRMATMSDERERHEQNQEFPAFCRCLSRWPCDGYTAALEAENARLRERDARMTPRTETIEDQG